jgi:hypothetical protein
MRRALDQLHVDIDPVVVNALTETDIAIWATPEGKTFDNGEHPSCSRNESLILHM